MSESDIQLHSESQLTAEAQMLLLQILRGTFGAKIAMLNYYVLKSRHDYVVLSVRLNHPKIQVIVKLAGAEASIACPFDRTAALHRLLRAHTRIPLPEVLEAD